MPALHTVLSDESVWETPHTFNPQHFLNPDGTFRKREAFFPFGAGQSGFLSIKSCNYNIKILRLILHRNTKNKKKSP